jgi:hypothetical protein
MPLLLSALQKISPKYRLLSSFDCEWDAMEAAASLTGSFSLPRPESKEGICSRQSTEVKAETLVEKPLAPKSESVAKRYIHFELRFDSKVLLRNTVAIVGSYEELGSWNSTRAFRLTWKTDNIWTGDLKVKIAPRAPSLVYKFIVVNENGEPTLGEVGSHREIQIAQLSNATSRNPLIVSTNWIDMAQKKS